MDFKRLQQLLGGKQFEPTMGDVKQADRDTGLGVRPQLVRGYGDDQDMMDKIRQNERNMAQLGVGVSEPGQESIDREKLIQDMAGSTGGIMRKIEPATKLVRGLTKIGKYEAPVENTAQGLKLREAMAKKGMVSADAPIGTGSLSGGISRQGDNTVSFTTQEVDDLIRDFPQLSKLFRPLR